MESLPFEFTPIQREWLDALRSDEYAQTNGQLRCEDAFCCLGVAMEIARNKGVIKDYDGGEGYPDTEVIDLFGFKPTCGETVQDGGTEALAWMNDQEHKSFAEIADEVEANPTHFFGEWTRPEDRE